MLIKKSNLLTTEEKIKIKELVSICNIFDNSKDCPFLSNEFNIYSHMDNFFLYYNNNKLLGFLNIYADNISIAEISAYVLPVERKQGIFKSLYKASLEELKKFNYNTIHFKTEKSSISSRKIIKKYNFPLIDKEYLMEFNKYSTLLTNRFSNNFLIRKSTKEDLSSLIYIQVQSFEEPYEVCETYVKQCFNNIDTILYTALLNNKIIGTCSVDASDNNNLIFGLCIAPQYQRQGFGSIMLKNIILDLLATNSKPITISVDTSNTLALNLYKSIGFNIISEYEYYEKKILS